MTHFTRSHNTMPPCYEGRKTFKCEIEECGYMFIKQSRLEHHMKTIHGSGTELKTKNRKRKMIRFNKSVLVKPGSIPCPECNKPITEPKMKSHMKRMHGEKPFKCVDCHRGFHSEKYLRQHLTNHRKYPCKDNPEMPLDF